MSISLSAPSISSASAKRSDGWLAINCLKDRVDLAHVQQAPGQMPEVVLLESYATGGDLQGALQRLRKEKRLHSHRCVVMLNSGDFQVLQVEAPSVPLDERRQALRWQIKDMLDYPVDAATLDVLDVPGQQGSGRAQQVLVVVAANAVLSPLAAAVVGAGLKLEAIDVPDMGQRNIAALLEKDNRAVALLTFDDDGGLLTVSAQGELYVSRRIDVSRQALEGAADERREQLFDRIVLEVQRTLDTFDRQYSFVPMGQLWLAQVPGGESLKAALTPNVYVPVETLNLGSVLHFPGIPELRHPERQAQCLKLLGCAMR